ncbi:hypothetical protein VUJ46_01530 [Chryseobacterium sp. MYb264]|uniref:hypothetical protein n=1 Tax=Chryseobacterium sp. MYb264 TaxID=2745153 RepID=UPI002E0F4B1C|nr:hypothetical protein VUJ46_01530 [Chryseobacterium sp. MYb264]
MVEIEIKIKMPFNLSINITEIDDYLPSFKVKMIYESEGNNFKFNNEIEFWIECKQWDIFLNQLNKKEKDIELIDINNITRFKFQSIDKDYLITINSSIRTMEINNMINIFEYKVEDELFEQIINGFKKFPKWW